jgi:hypothetical protein
VISLSSTNIPIYTVAYLKVNNKNKLKKNKGVIKRYHRDNQKIP